MNAPRPRAARLRPCLLMTAMLSAPWTCRVHAANADESLPRAPASSDALVMTPCELPDLKEAARCGVLQVPENPDEPGGRKLAIAVAVVPATSGKALPDPIVPLMGGPGEDAVSAAAAFAERFATLRAARDLLLVDQRGTGRSGALRCELFVAKDPGANLRDIFPLKAVKRCARQLSARADLTQYGYSRFADDLERVRLALGYGALNVSAGSYGTRAAQVYVRAYPQSVRTLYLGSVVPIDVAMPLPLATAAQLALEKKLDACAADAACHDAFPDLGKELHEVMARLDSGTASVQMPGSASPMVLNRGRVAEWLRQKLYRAESATVVPWLIHHAYIGDWSPIAEGIISDAREYDSALAFGLFFSITCNEDVAFLREEDIGPQTSDTFIGDYRVRQQQAACRAWPRYTLPLSYRKPLASSVPTLFVSGDTDPASALWLTSHMAPGFSDRVEVVLPGLGHTEWTDCVARLYEKFVQSGAVRGLDAGSCKPEPLPPFKTQ